MAVFWAGWPVEANLARRLFRRPTLFLWKIWVLAALSKALKAFLRLSRDGFLRTLFSVSLIFRSIPLLWISLLRSFLNFFFALLMIGMEAMLAQKAILDKGKSLERGISIFSHSF